MAPERTFDAVSLARTFTEIVPHVRELGIELVEVGEGTLTIRLPYHDRLVGNPETGVLHGGVITTLIDSVCGFAVSTTLTEIVPLATLDLRIDYLKPATPESDLFARAHCYKVTRYVAFVRGVAYHDDPDDAIANAVGAFVIGAVAGSFPPRQENQE